MGINVQKTIGKNPLTASRIAASLKNQLDKLRPTGVTAVDSEGEDAIVFTLGKSANLDYFRFTLTDPELAISLQG